ncbi:hypothetical protein ACMHYB_35530 [Sorangium sp. So ce1128]
MHCAGRYRDPCGAPVKSTKLDVRYHADDSTALDVAAEAAWRELFFPEWGRGLARIPAQGGEVRFVSEVRPDLGDYAQVLPCVLPDNKVTHMRVMLGWDQRLP